MEVAKYANHHDTVSVLTQVVGEGVVSDGMCGGSDGAWWCGMLYECGGDCDYVCCKCVYCECVRVAIVCGVRVCDGAGW